MTISHRFVQKRIKNIPNIKCHFTKILYFYIIFPHKNSIITYQLFNKNVRCYLYEITLNIS